MRLNDLCFTDAIDLASLIRNREVSAVEVVTAHLEQIENFNPMVNAICTLLPEEALRQAEQADRTSAANEETGPLHGLPIAVKDLVDTKGIRTTYGSRIYKDHIPAADALFVERLRAAGAIIIGKTNTPEFGAGSQTFNEVFGATRNPYDLTKTCGGSSGGAAVALATGMIPIADGSDLGGSLRNPASFCNVVGFRPTPGRVPTWPSAMPWFSLSVEGPMARTVRDVALLLSVMAGPDARSPITIDEPGVSFLRPLDRDFGGTRVAWTRNLGQYEVEPVVIEACEKSLATFAELGCEIEEATPDFSDATEIFQTLRAWGFAANRKDDLRRHRHLMKDTVIWNIEKGLELDAMDVAEAEIKRAALYHRVREFMERYEFLLLPVAQVAPFPIEQQWVRLINGVAMKTYVDWMATCWAITLTGLPAISVPCGFTSDGLPIGLQIVGRFRKEFEVLQIANAFEKATQFGRVRCLPHRLPSSIGQ
jgi:amidase